MAAALNIPQLAQVPQCAYPAYGAIAAAGCGSSLACICANDNFLITLQGVIFAGNCSPPAIEASLSATRTICTEAVPWLNDSRGPEIVAAITIMSLIATMAIFLRILARRISGLGLGVDDWLLIGSFIWSWGLTIIQYVAVHEGIGKHMLMLNLDQMTSFTKCFVAATIVFGVAVVCLKLSILFFYCRIIPLRRFTTVSKIIGGICILYFIAFELVQFLTCRPFQFYWDKTIIGGHCLDQKLLAYVFTIPVDILTNIAILILPIPYLWNLQMQRAKKIAIIGIFILGSFAVVGSIIRIPFFIELKYTDVSYTIVNSSIWLNVECNIGIVSACLPVMRPLFGGTFASSFRSRFTKSRSANRYYSAGSQRLPDSEKAGASASSASSKSKTKSRSWMKSEASAVRSGNSHHNKDKDGASEEVIIPMGRIGVKHDVRWDEEERSRRESEVDTETETHAV